MSNTLNDLYAKKGQIITTQELLNSQLGEINRGISAELKKATPPPVKEEEPEEKKEPEKTPGD